MAQTSTRAKTKRTTPKAKSKAKAGARPKPAAPAGKAPRGKQAQPPTEDVRERVVSSALKLFAKSGFDGTTITQVARDAGIVSPLVYYYFSDKDELWRAAADYALRDWSVNMATVQKELSDADPVTVLKVQLRRFVYFSARHRDFSHLVINEAGTGNERMKWLIERHLRPLHEGASKALEEAMAKGLIKKINPAFLNQFVIGGTGHVLNSMLLLNTIYGVNPLDEKIVDAFADFLIDILFNGALPRK